MENDQVKPPPFYYVTCLELRLGLDTHSVALISLSHESRPSYGALAPRDWLFMSERPTQLRLRSSQPQIPRSCPGRTLQSIKPHDLSPMPSGKCYEKSSAVCLLTIPSFNPPLLPTHGSDHHISRRVRVLSLRPGALFRWLYPCPSSFLGSVRNVFLSGGSKCGVHRKQKIPTLFSSAIHQLNNVEELRLLLNGPGHWHATRRSCLLFHNDLDHYPVDLVQNFADFIWSALGKQLTTLEITINPFAPVQMLPPLGVLGQLKHLEICISSCNELMVAQKRFASLINSLSLTLESLSINATNNFYLVDSIGVLPHLKHLDLCMMASSRKSSQFHFPSQLVQVNQSIQVLRIHWTEFEAPMDFMGVKPSHSQWILPNLHVLEFELQVKNDDSKRGHLIKSLALLSNSLTSLYVHLPLLAWRDFQDILTSFVLDKLLDLTVFVFSITPQVIDLIAKCCPSLLKLTLIARRIGPAYEEPRGYGEITNDMVCV